MFFWPSCPKCLDSQIGGLTSPFAFHAFVVSLTWLGADGPLLLEGPIGHLQILPKYWQNAHSCTTESHSAVTCAVRCLQRPCVWLQDAHMPMLRSASWLHPSRERFCWSCQARSRGTCTQLKLAWKIMSACLCLRQGCSGWRCTAAGSLGRQKLSQAITQGAPFANDLCQVPF